VALPVGELDLNAFARLIGPRVQDDAEPANQAPPATEPPAHDKVA